jgi:hypothetical protein
MTHDLSTGDVMTRRWLLIRHAWEDRHPTGVDLQQTARDSVIRCAIWFGLAMQWDHDQRGERWVMAADGPSPTGIAGWRSTAIITGPMPPELERSGAGKWLNHSSG